MKKLVFLLGLMQLAFLVEINGQLTNGLVSYWKFDETTLGNVLDSKGNNNGTTEGGMLMPGMTGIIDKAMFIEGYVSVPYSTSLDITGNAITLSAWIKPSVTGKTQMIMSKIHATHSHVSPYFQYNLQLYYGSSKMYPRFLLSVGGVVKMAANSAHNLNVNEWYHIVGTYDGTTMRLFLNGTQIASSPVTGNISGYNTPLYFGVNGANGEDYLGLIDESGIWNRALTAEEIDSLYNDGFGLPYPLTNNYVLSTAVSPTAGGSIFLSPSGGSYAAGTTVTATAVNHLGYTFSGWSGALTGTSNPDTISMNANKTLTATFTPEIDTWQTTGSNNMYYVGGNVGIGTKTPSEKLQIGVQQNYGEFKLSIPGQYNFEQIKLGQYGNGRPGLEFINHTTMTNSFGVRFYANIDDGIQGLQIQTASPTNSYESLSYITRLVINTDGKVGIGTLNPTEKLTVSGKILATEVEVVSSIASDYVFEPAYQLMPLTELEIYLKQHKHLPGIPSALEFKKQGQNLGEMQDMLLRKIEELTLYILIQERNIKEQDISIKELHEKIEMLETLIK